MSKTGEFRTQLPQGADVDDFKMSVYVQVIDNDEGIAYYQYANQLVVEPNMTRIDQLFEGLLNDDKEIMSSMFSGTPDEMTKNLASLSTALNSISKAANVSRNGNFYK